MVKQRRTNRITDKLGNGIKWFDLYAEQPGFTVQGRRTFKTYYTQFKKVN